MRNSREKIYIALVDDDKKFVDLYAQFVINYLELKDVEVQLDIFDDALKFEESEIFYDLS